MPERIQRKRTKDPRPGSSRPCYRCGTARATQGQNGFCSADCRFWSKVDRRTDDDCWLWQGARQNTKGYGRFDASGLRWLAHRFAYTVLVEPISDGHELDHLCKNTRCVNPAHLEPVTPEEHSRRSDQGAYQRAITACPEMHPYSPGNTRVDTNGRRHCRTCDNDRNRRWRRARANSAA